MLILLELKQVEQMTHRIFYSFMKEGFRFMRTELASTSKGAGAHSRSVHSLKGHHRAPPAPDSGGELGDSSLPTGSLPTSTRDRLGLSRRITATW